MVSDPLARNPFTDVDGLPPEVSAMVIGALEGMAAHPEIRRVRRLAWEALRPAPGQRLLDAGCGAGEVARELAGEVSGGVSGRFGGEVVALDYSAVTVAAAAQRHDGSAVCYLTGDVSALEFPDGHFDGVRSERVLQHVADPDRAIAELVRVTRPGGRVCLIDTDWESIVIDGPPEDLLTAVRDHAFQPSVLHHRTIGRTLRRRLVSAGLTDVTATPVTCCFTHPVSAAAVLPILNPLVPAEVGMLRPDLRDRWFAEIDASAGRDEFLAALTIWVAAGSVPR
jgi:ubiquinone/menaquinone biosynthesis C-methylase UbiE